MIIQGYGAVNTLAQSPTWARKKGAAGAGDGPIGRWISQEGGDSLLALPVKLSLEAAANGTAHYGILARSSRKRSGVAVGSVAGDE